MHTSKPKLYKALLGRPHVCLRPELHDFRFHIEDIASQLIVLTREFRKLRLEAVYAFQITGNALVQRLHAVYDRR